MTEGDWGKCRHARRQDLEAVAGVGRVVDVGGRRNKADQCHVTEDEMRRYCVYC
jgi:hypothetical protein